jgi:hypothetical protein
MPGEKTDSKTGADGPTSHWLKIEEWLLIGQSIRRVLRARRGEAPGTRGSELWTPSLSPSCSDLMDSDRFTTPHLYMYQFRIALKNVPASSVVDPGPDPHQIEQ